MLRPIPPVSWIPLAIIWFGIADKPAIFLVFLGAFLANPAVAGAAAFVMVLAAVYLLWMYQRVFTGPLSSFLEGLGEHLTDISRIEAATLAPLAVLIVVFGVAPTLLSGTFASSVATFLGAAANWVAP